jgi:hypothetical protein
VSKDEDRPDSSKPRPSRPVEDRADPSGEDDQAPDKILLPASSRKPRSLKDELPLDDGLPGILDPDVETLPESAERPPASRKVASQRGSDVSADDITTWDMEALGAEAPPTRKTEGPSASRRGAVAPEARVIVDRSAEPETLDPRRSLPERDLVVLASAGRSFRPTTFGELLDDALSLGQDD